MISGVATKWILDCGASTHVTNGKSAISARIPIEEPSAILTADGVKSLMDSVIVSIPCIDGFRNAVVAERSPNLANLGKLIMEDGYRIRGWSVEGGLWFEDPQGRIVPTYIEDFVPFLGTPGNEEHCNEMSGLVKARERGKRSHSGIQGCDRQHHGPFVCDD